MRQDSHTSQSAACAVRKFILQYVVSTQIDTASLTDYRWPQRAVARGSRQESPVDAACSSRAASVVGATDCCARLSSLDAVTLR
jgi:hypothetical protein